MKPEKFDVAIIGAGAAGLFCASHAALRGRSVALLDHAKTLGEKIRISGGGRCNFTNVHASPNNYLSQNPHFCRSALARYTAQDFIGLVRQHRIAFHEKTLGQLFCDGSSQQIIDMLISEAMQSGVTIIHPAIVQTIEKTERFRVTTDRGVLDVAQVVIATGGLSVPATGATAFGYKIAEQFNVPVTPLRAGLVPLALDAPDIERYAELTGVSFDATVSVAEAASAKQPRRARAPMFREKVLLTHRGLSGPAILQISNYWTSGEALSLNLLPDQDADAIIANARTNNVAFSTALSAFLPHRFAQAWASAHAPQASLAQWTKEDLRRVAALLQQWPLQPSGTLGYKKAEVTLGGVDTRALSSQTMMVQSVPGLYFIGEVVDVTGWLGGYNFQWAWSSAVACAEALRQ